MTRELRSTALVAFVLLLGTLTVEGATLHREWCTGVSPVSWGFTITPDAATSEVRLRAASPNVRLLGAQAGPGLPGWTVELVNDAELVARGTTPLAAGKPHEAALVLETNRSTSSVNRKGAFPVRWELATGSGRARTFSFPPVLELADAASRGLVLVTVEPHGPAGPVEITVDNPTWQPLWLDVPPGTVLERGGEQWVVGLMRPFQMMRKQKTGRTVRAFPARPSSSPRAPHRLNWANRLHDHADVIAELGIAVQQLQERSDRGQRPSGHFESFEPFEFWPLAFQWGVWKATGPTDDALLVGLVADLLRQRASAGDRSAARIDPKAAAAEIQRAQAEAEALRAALRAGALPVAHQASRARFPGRPSGGRWGL